MAVSIGDHIINTDPAVVETERGRLQGLSPAEVAAEVKAAKEIIGMANRARGAAGIRDATQEGATLEAAGIIDVAHNDRDLLLP